uniref:Cerevisin n=3 Tax=Tetraselmis sp. GSL018 TaxID=582737 RepID=A0A061SCC5_9CHLO
MPTGPMLAALCEVAGSEALGWLLEAGAGDIAFLERDGPAEAADAPREQRPRPPEPFPPHGSSRKLGASGRGVTLYVVDTAIMRSHEDFRASGPLPNGTRVEEGFDAVHDGLGNTSSCSAHGTHVASVAAGAVHGVAEHATIVPVRVLDCSGGASVSSVVRGMSWVAGRAEPPSVAILSLSAGVSPALDAAARALLSAGVHVVAAAGNQNSDACWFSPGRVSGVVTVGASDRRGALLLPGEGHGGSNVGPCIDVFAPGDRVVGAGIAQDDAASFSSGTSAAAPSVAGAMALFLERHPNASPAELQRAVVLSAAPGRVLGLPLGTPNLLLDARNLLRVGLSSPLEFSTPRLEVVTSNDEQTYNVSVRLSREPTSRVEVSFLNVIPSLFAWLDAQPLTFYPSDWNTSQLLQVKFNLQTSDRTKRFNLYFSTSSRDENYEGWNSFLPVYDLRGDTIRHPLVIPGLPFMYTGSTAALQDDYDVECLDSPVAPRRAPDAVFTFMPAASARVVIATCGSSFDTKLFVYHNTTEILESVTQTQCNDDFGRGDCRTQSLLQVDMVAGLHYAIVVDGWNGAYGDFVLRVFSSTGSPLPAL